MNYQTTPFEIEMNENIILIIKNKKYNKNMIKEYKEYKIYNYAWLNKNLTQEKKTNFDLQCGFIHPLHKQLSDLANVHSSHF